MFLFRYFKINKVSLGTISSNMVFLLLLLELAIWYPVLSERYGEKEKQWKLKIRSEKVWEGLHQQSLWLDKQSALVKGWAISTVLQKEPDFPTTWQLEGSASILEWQTLLEWAQENVPLGVMSSYWERRKNGDWFGRHVFDIEAPNKNREYRNWLPTRHQGEQFIKKDWRVLSTMKGVNSTSALLEYKNNLHWVKKGSWFPSAELTVDFVSLDQVMLIMKNGKHVVLSVREEGADND